MDAISAGASVLAFITLAIQSAKTISVVLTGIKDAPDNVRRTANTVSMLQWALEQLAQSQQTSGAAFPRGIEEQVKTCSDNLAAFASTLSNLQALDTDGRGRRVWKRVKAVIDEKELDKMTGIMAAHASTLNLSLQSTQIAILHDGRNQVSHFSQNIRGIHTDMARADARREEQWSGIRTTLDQTKAICDVTRTSSDEQLRDIQALTAALTRVETKVDGQDTENKLSRIWDTLQSLAGYIQNQPDNGLQTKALKDRKLRGCIGRLCSQVNQENRTVSADDVDSILDDLKYVLAAANDQCDEVVNIKRLERIGGLLSSAHMLSINGTEPNTTPGGRIIQRDRRRGAYEMGDGSLTISTVKRRRLTETTHYDDADGIEDFIAKLTYFPRSGTGGMFKANITQQAFRSGTFSSIPRLQVNLVLPEDSLVFQLVEEGRVMEFEALLREGKASLRDHDERGNSLLAIAAWFSQPQMCRFLLSKHADVEVYHYRWLVGSGSPKSRYHGSILGTTTNRFARGGSTVQDCHRLLLNAGADPMDDTTDAGITPFFDVFRSGNKDLMELYLDSCEGFADMSLRDTQGLNPFLSACRHPGQGYSKAVFSLLLDRGANISDLDPTGKSCLHHFLLGARDVLSLETERDALIYLIERGADVWARDHAGLSVSHWAYTMSYSTIHLGSYERDLWDLALTAGGYNVTEVRGNIRRVGRYPDINEAGVYSRDCFRRLWKGREHLCPYPEDLEDFGVDFAHQFVPHAENSDADDSYTKDSDAEDADAENTDYDGSDAEDSDVKDSNSNGSGLTKSSDNDKCKRWSRCETCQMEMEVVKYRGFLKTCQMEDPECRRCGWSFGCRDPNCGCCNDSDDSSIMTREVSADVQEEEHEMPDAIPSDPLAEAWSGSPVAQSSPFIQAPDHISVKADIQHWAEDVPYLDDMETHGRGLQSSIPVIELDNPWADAE